MKENKLTFYGGVDSVTGANFLLETGNRKILIDCGLTQNGPNSLWMNKRKFEYDPASIDPLIITHAHIDHIGLVPRLVREGFRGEIYSTEETKDLAALLLTDALKVGKEENDSLYEIDDINKALGLWKTLPYHETRDLGDISFEFFNAGHILGSALARITLPNGETVLFTGDLGNPDSPLLQNTEKVEGSDYLVMESVYGDKWHEDKKIRKEKLQKIIKETIDRKGTLLIPVFALERSQILLNELDNLFESREVLSVPVFLDSPLAIRITEIYEKETKQYNSRVQEELRAGDKIFRFPGLKFTAEIRDSAEINRTTGAKIILAGSGMSTAGRIVSHEKKYLPDSNTTILFVGYQAPGTLGREILEGKKKVLIDGEEVYVRAKVESIDGYSAHADSDTLMKFVEEMKNAPKKIFVVMGEPRSSIFLTQRIRDELGLEAIVPERGNSYLL